MARYDDRTALIVTDVQNDFTDPAGSVYVPGGEEVVERVDEEVDRAMEAGSVMVYTQDWHPINGVLPPIPRVRTLRRTAPTRPSTSATAPVVQPICG